jgi:hypothetical protein
MTCPFIIKLLAAYGALSLAMKVYRFIERIR